MDRRRFLKLSAAASTFAAVGGGVGAEEKTVERQRPFLDTERLKARNQNRSTVVCRHGMVCASQPLAAMAGIDILKAGGNCVDAAIATNAALGVVEPASNGIGGDLFAILWMEKDRRLYGLNASGRAPRAWTLRAAHDMGLNSIPRQSPLAWNVPGCVSGWGLLNQRFGKLSLAKCLEGAIALAGEGFPLSPIIGTEHFAWPDEMAPHMAKVYHPNGRAPKYGEIFQNPLLARSLQSIAKDGPKAFYEGEIAERIVAKSRELGGKMELVDLKEHTANWVEPVGTNYRGWDVWEIPPNGQGISVLQILNILECFDIGALAPNSAEHLHLFIEAKKLAYEDRAVYYADPEFADVPVAQLISKEYGKARAKLINPAKANVEVGYGDPLLDTDTIYMTAADGDGNMISYIQSNYSGYGSTICPDECGFVIQDRGRSFSLDPNHRNKLEPGKRPFHTIIPGFMTNDGKPVMSFGVMGGDFQPQGHSQIVMNMIDFGMSPQQAGDQPRVSHDGSSSPWGGAMDKGGTIQFERGFDDGVKQKLADMGHRINDAIDAHGGYQAIWREDEPLRYFGGSDPRLDGAAIGY
ncbi:MAG: gamma-glutamyltransferase [Candidatus Hydrogenedentota bacterium]